MRVLCRLLASLTLIAAAATSAADPGQRRLTADQVVRDVALAREAFERVHPGYDRYTDGETLGAAWERLASPGRGGMTVGEFYLGLQGVLALVRCDHTKAELPEDMRAARRDARVYLPARWQIVEGRGIVLDAAEDSDLAVGDEILAVDGTPLAALIDRYAPLVPVDGFTDHVRETQLAYSAEFMGGAIEHFTAVAGDLSATARLRIRRAERILEVGVERLDFDAWRELLARTVRFRRDFADSVRYEPIGDDIAWLSVETFVNYRNPVDPDEVYGPIFERLRKEGRGTLILDLRRNGGGSNDAMRRLFAHLIDEKTRLQRPSRVRTLNLDGLREHLGTWDQRALKPRRWQFRRNDDGTFSPRWFLSDEARAVRPARNAFDGRLIVLAGPANSSGSTNLIARLQDLGRATVVGAPTGGSAEGPTAGVLFFLTLPESRVVARLPAMRGFNAVERFEPGLGVVPDVKVATGADDLLAGRDPVRAAALELANRPRSGK